jgi:DNA-3-methyladenine glycosylase II
MPKAGRVKEATPSTLDEASLRRAVRRLAARDADLARVVEEYGPPPLWAREPGFNALVQIILEQQVSLASARAAYERLLAVARPLTPARLLALDDAALRAAGLTRQKTAYMKDLARAIAEGRLSLSEVERMGDEDVRAELTKVKGVGRWTSDIYLLMALGRADAWPAGDLALAAAAQRVKRIPVRPTPQELDDLGEAWRPMRAVAARILWHHYLSAPKNRR